MCFQGSRMEEIIWEKRDMMATIGKEDLLPGEEELLWVSSRKLERTQLRNSNLRT